MKRLLLLLFLITPSIRSTDNTTSTEPPTVAITGFTSVCQSCLDFVIHIPGISDSYEEGVGIDPNTLCTELAKKMPSVETPCFKLFADHWPTATNVTALEICTAFYYC